GQCVIQLPYAPAEQTRRDSDVRRRDVLDIWRKTREGRSERTVRRRSCLYGNLAGADIENDLSWSVAPCQRHRCRNGRVSAEGHASKRAEVLHVVRPLVARAPGGQERSFGITDLCGDGEHLLVAEAARVQDQA